MSERSDFQEWRRSLHWNQAKGALEAPDGSLWELEDEESETYVEVSLSEQEVQSREEAGW